MRYLIIIILLLIPSLAEARACISARAGNWSSFTTWTSAGSQAYTCKSGSVPGSGDTAEVRHTVTVDATTTINGFTVGNSSAASTATLTIPSSVTLTTTGPAGIAQYTGSTNTLTIQAGGTLDLTNQTLNIGTLSGVRTGTATFNITGTGWGSGQYGTVTGTTGSLIQAGQLYGTIKLHWDYALITGITTASGGLGNQISRYNANASGSIYVHNTRFINTGSWQFGGSTYAATAVLDFDKVDFRAITPRTTLFGTGYALVFASNGTPPSGSGVRSITNSTFASPGGGSIAFSIDSGTITDNVLCVSTVSAGAYGGRNTIERNQIITPSTAPSTGNYWLPTTGGDTLSNNILAANNVNHHGISNTGTALAPNGDLTIQYNLIQSMYGGANPLLGTAAMKYIVANNIILGGEQDFNETHHANNNDIIIKNNTFLFRGSASLWKCEGNLPPLGKQVFKNNIFYLFDAATAYVANRWGWETGADPLGPGGFFDYNVRYAPAGALYDFNLSAPLNFVQFVDTYTTLSGTAARIGNDSLSITGDHTAALPADTWIRIATSIPAGTLKFTRKVQSASFDGTLTTITLYPAYELNGNPASVNTYRYVPATILGVEAATALKTYGVSTGFAGHNTTLDPQFAGGTALRTLTEYVNEKLGTTGKTLDDFIYESLKVNGLDKDGNPATFNAAFDTVTVLNDIHSYYKVGNQALLTAGIADDGVSPTRVGAYAPILYPIGMFGM